MVETSPDGKLRLEAKSPDNTPDYNAPFAANFVYTLYDSASSKVVWTRAQPKSDRMGVQEKDEGSPIAAFVHDSGAVVVWTGFHYLMVLDAKGTVALELSILDSIPAAEQQQHVRWSTAGPLWSGSSHWYYFAANEKLHFGIRTWWDRRASWSAFPTPIRSSTKGRFGKRPWPPSESTPCRPCGKPVT